MKQLAFFCTCCLASVGLAASISFAVTSNQETNDWQILRVPGSWEDETEFADHDGFAWYRCYAKVPESWTDLDGRPLWYESVTLTISSLADAHELYINGQKIGGAGSLPPKFSDGSKQLRRYKIPPGVLKPSKYNTIALRVYNQDGNGGFMGDPPVLAGYFLESVLKGDWGFRTGDDLKWATGATKERPDFAVFDKFTESSSVLRRPETWNPGKRISPKDSLEAMQVAEDLKVDLVLAEPLIAQPLSMTFDERGRMWLVEYRQYPYPAGLKMVSRNKYYRAVFDKVPSAPPNHDPGADRISIHEDTNGDGSFDKHTTFVDSLNIATSAIKGRGGVWVLNSPYLLFYPDKDADDVPDGDPEVHLRGFGLADAHSAPNSLHWGPDGWLYGVQGSNIASHIKIGPDPETSVGDPSDRVANRLENETSVPPEQGVYREGPAVWRYHPETSRFEFFAEGGGNAFGLEFDAQGRIYSGHNGSNTRGFYYVQGGYYQKGTERKFGAASNPYAFGALPFMAHGTAPRFSHTFVKYESDSLPDSYRGKLLSVDSLHRNIVLSNIEPAGSTFATADESVPLASDAVTFRPVDIRVGPEGALYIVDFCEEFIAHGQHYQGMLDIESGRVYRLQSKDAKATRATDFSKLSTAGLVEQLKQPNKWQRQTALRLIADRQDVSVTSVLMEMLDDDGQPALEALWALNLLGRFDDALAIRAIEHQNPHVRRWAVRLLGDQQKVTPAIAARLVRLAASDKDVEVAVQLAASATRLPADTCLPIVAELSGRDEFAKDPMLPLLLWWAMESKTASDSEAVLALFDTDDFWHHAMIANSVLPQVMRRFASADSREDLMQCARLLNGAPDAGSRQQLMVGFEQAFRGRSMSALPVELAKLLTDAGGGSLSLRVRLGDQSAINEALKFLSDESSDSLSRTELAQVFGEVLIPECVPVLLKLVVSKDMTVDEGVQSAALAALQSYNSIEIPNGVLAAYSEMTEDVREVALTLLVSRKDWAKMLLQKIDDNEIDSQTISADTVRKMTIHNDEQITKLCEKHFGIVRGATNVQMQERIAVLNKELAAKPGDVYAGKPLFAANCGKCHLMFGEGGRIGPDLSQYQRDDVLRMLLHIVNPNAEIREGYETVTVLTDEGRVISGFLFDQDKQVVVVRGSDGQNITIARESIGEMKRNGLSLMPEGLLDKMTNQQVRDLFAFLRSSQPVHK